MCWPCADEIRIAGTPSPQVTRLLRLLTSAVERYYEDQDDAIAALVPDPQGIGSGPDVSAHTRDDPVARLTSTVGEPDS
jgi:hypothetical protein